MGTYLPNTLSSAGSLVCSISLTITEQLISPWSFNSNSILICCPVFILKEHPWQLHLNTLSSGGVGYGIQVKVTLSPTVCSKLRGGLTV